MNTTTWFITGASSGFGFAFAKYALEQGYNVVATARNKDKLASLVSRAPSKVLALELDVTNPEHMQPALEETLRRFGRVDVLINNAGYGIVGAAEETPDAELRAQIETNFFGAVNVTRAFLPVFREQSVGAIVNISSMGGAMSFAGFSAYSASKFALEGYSEALAQEMAAFSVKVMIVEPGAFRTDFAGQALRHMPQLAAYESVVGQTREFATAMDQTQEGDPVKAATAIDLALQATNTPLRLQLGIDAIDAVRLSAQARIEEINDWQHLGRSTNICATQADVA